MAKMSMELQLPIPILKIGVQDIEINWKRRRRGKDRGPFLIVSRSSGLALDAGISTGIDDKPCLWTVHAERQQLWKLRPSGTDGEVIIISEVNGLALSITPERRAHDDWPLLQEPRGELWQSWRLDKTPDDVAHLLHAANSGHFLRVADDNKCGWKPYLKPRKAERTQQWVLVQPFGV